jgi:hypothetical protein
VSEQPAEPPCRYDKPVSASASQFIKYHEKTPHDGRIYSFMDTWMLPLACAGMGLLVFLASLISLLRGLILIFAPT